MVLPPVGGGFTTSELISYLKSSLYENEVNAPVHQFVVLHHSCCVGVIGAELNFRKSWQSHLSVYSHQAQVGSFLPEIHYFLLGLPGGTLWWSTSSLCTVIVDCCCFFIMILIAWTAWVHTGEEISFLTYVNLCLYFLLYDVLSVFWILEEHCVWVIVENSKISLIKMFELSGESSGNMQTWLFFPRTFGEVNFSFNWIPDLLAQIVFVCDSQRLHGCLCLFAS